MAVKNAKWLAGLTMLTFALASCSNMFNSSDYEVKRVIAAPSMDFPLASGNLVIEDFLTKSDKAIIGQDPDGVVYLQYDDTLKSQGLNDLLDFPDKGFNVDVIVPGGTLPANNAEVKYASLSSSEDFAFNPEKLSEIKFKSTTLTLSAKIVPANANVDSIEIKFSTFKLNGVSFDKKFPLKSSIPLVDLAGYVATLNSNQFPIDIAVYIKPHAGLLVMPPSTVTVSLTFNVIDYRYVKGFFGDQTNTSIPPQTIVFNEFGKAFTKAKVSFADPQLSFTVTNDYGIPTNVTFNPLEAKKDNGTSLAIQLNPPNPIAINLPAQLGQSATTDVTITNSKQLIDFAPNQFYYKISAHINQGLVSGNNFCADTSKIRVNFKAKIPLYGRASDIVLADTFDIDLKDAKNSKLESGSILANVKNEMPLDAFIQLYFLDSLNRVDSLFTTAQTALVKSSVVNTQGELQSATELNQTIDLVTEKLNKILEAKKIVVRAKMNTSKDSGGNPIDVKFKWGYKMTVNFGLKVKLKVDYRL